jgi:hypothetical protein
VALKLGTSMYGSRNVTSIIIGPNSWHVMIPSVTLLHIMEVPGVFYRLVLAPPTPQLRRLERQTLMRVDDFR